MGKKTLESLQMGIQVFKTKNFGLMDKLTDLEVEIDKMYRAYLREVVGKPPERIQTLVSNVLVFRHLERIADHACYIAEETYYMVHGRTMYVR
jgi:phosphate transport system protein